MCWLSLCFSLRLNCYPTAQMCLHWPEWCKRTASCWSRPYWRWEAPHYTFNRHTQKCFIISPMLRFAVLSHIKLFSLIVIKSPVSNFSPALSRASGVGHLGAWWTSLQKCFSAWTSTAFLCSLCGWRRRCSLLGSRHRGSQLNRKTTSHIRYSGNTAGHSFTGLSANESIHLVNPMIYRIYFIIVCISPPLSYRERVNKRRVKDIVKEFTLLCRGLHGTEYAAEYWNSTLELSPNRDLCP